MDLYSYKKNKIDSIDLIPFKKEKDIQELIEHNTETLFQVEFVSSEFGIEDFRIDTLCFNTETNSFTIIEYKKGSSYSVIDQGYSYLSVMLNNKDSFILEYCKQKNVPVDIEVDWSQSKVIFVSPSFNSYQKNSVNFKDIPFELWEIKRFNNNTIVLNQHVSNSSESIKKVTGGKDTVISSVNKEVVVYDEEYHTSKLDDNMKDRWDELKGKCSELENVKLKVTKHYIGVVKDSKTVLVCDFVFTKKKIEIRLRRGNVKPDGSKSKNFFTLDDPKKLSREISWVWKSGDTGIVYKYPFNNSSDLDYTMFIIKQRYNHLD